MMIFIPMADDIATCMYYTGIDPFTRQQVYVARALRDRKVPKRGYHSAARAGRGNK